MYDVAFPDLMVIRLRENYIESIEGFHRTQIPKLRELWISRCAIDEDYNYLSSVKDFRKANFPHLSKIGFRNNLLR